MVGKKYFQIIVFVSLFLVTFSFVHGEAYRKYIFYDSAGNPVTNVVVIGWACKTSDCSQVDWVIPSLSPNGQSSGNNNFYDVAFPETCPANKYLLRFFASGFRSKAWAKVCITGSNGFRAPDYYFQGSTAFSKKSNCQSIFTPTIATCAEAGLPLTILTDTSLEPATASAFTPTGYYYPPEFADWINVTTRMTVDIRKQGETSSVSGYPAYQDYRIR